MTWADAVVGWNFVKPNGSESLECGTAACNSSPRFSWKEDNRKSTYIHHRRGQLETKKEFTSTDAPTVAKWDSD